MDFKFSERAGIVEPSILRSAWKLFTPSTIKFAAGCPDSECLPNKELSSIAEEILSSEEGVMALSYNDSDGYLPLRENVAKIMSSRGIDASADKIVMTNGSQQGIDFVGRILLDIGDTVLIEKPTYIGALNTLKNYQCNFVTVDSDVDGMLIDDLEKKLKSENKVKFIYMISNFQNPTGRVWSLERRKKLVELANKYNVIIVEDDPYGELRFDGEGVPICKSFDTEGRVIYLGTFSKILAPGLRVGWVYADEEIKYKILMCKQTVDMHVCALTQRIVNKYIAEINLKERIDELIEFYGNRRNLMMEALDKYMPEEVLYEKPLGGLFIWLELPENVDTTKLFFESLKNNVAYMPGTMFFSDDNINNYIRLCFSQENSEQIDKGIKILANMIKEKIEMEKQELSKVG
ncbi:aminotransferase-like domain-containing protein [Clostridium sp. DL1XJH146]